MQVLQGWCLGPVWPVLLLLALQSCPPSPLLGLWVSSRQLAWLLAAMLDHALPTTLPYLLLPILALPTIAVTGLALLPSDSPAGGSAASQSHSGCLNLLACLLPSCLTLLLSHLTATSFLTSQDWAACGAFQAGSVVGSLVAGRVLQSHPARPASLSLAALLGHAALLVVPAPPGSLLPAALLAGAATSAASFSLTTAGSIQSSKSVLLANPGISSPAKGQEKLISLLRFTHLGLSRARVFWSELIFMSQSPLLIIGVVCS